VTGVQTCALPIFQACQRAGKIPGIFAGTPALARRWIEHGYQFVTVGADTRLLESAAQQILLEVNSGTA